MDDVARVFNWEHIAEQEAKLADMLLTNVKGVFDHVNSNCLQHIMELMRADINLIRWTKSFI